MEAVPFGACGNRFIKISTGMNKILYVFVAFFMLTNVAFAQTNFEELTLAKALEKAKAENKLVFVDTYTSWCMPCQVHGEYDISETGDGSVFESPFCLREV